MSLYKPKESYNNCATLTDNPCHAGQDDVHSGTGSDNDDRGHGKGKERLQKDVCPDPGTESNESIMPDALSGATYGEGGYD